jgi:hypothetical protein
MDQRVQRLRPAFIVFFCLLRKKKKNTTDRRGEIKELFPFTGFMYIQYYRPKLFIFLNVK